MKNRGARILGLISLLQALGCSTLSGSIGEARWVPDSSLANLHPAPASMAPQVTSAEGDVSIDPTYMKAQADYHFTMGEALSLEGKPERAIEEFKLTLVYDANSVLVRERLAVEYVRMGLMSEALERAEEAVKMDGDSVEARLLYAGLLSSLKMYDQALIQYHEVLRAHPEHADVPLYIGAILAEQLKYDEAVAHFKKVAQTPKYPAPEKAHFYIGRIRVEQGGDKNLAEAKNALSAALKEKPDYEEAVLALSTVFQEMGQDHSALRLLQSYQDRFGPARDVARYLVKAYMDKEDFDRAYEQLEVLEGFERDNLNVRAQMALILIERKHYEKAAIRLEDILAQAPELDKIRYYLGAVYEELKKSDLAIQQYMQVPPSSSYFSEAIIHSAALYRDMKKPKQALSVLEKAMKLREDIPQFHAYYASILDDQKDYKKATQFLVDAVKRFPTSAQLHFFLGSMHDRMGNQDATVSQMQKVLQIEEDHVQALNYLAYLYAEKGTNLDDAEALARRALSQSPEDGYILDTVGWVLFKQGNVSQAIQYLEAAFKAKSTEAIIAEHLGDAYVRSQLFDKAKQMYQRAAELEAGGDRQIIIENKIVAIDRQRQDILQRVPASATQDTSH